MSVQLFGNRHPENQLVFTALIAAANAGIEATVSADFSSSDAESEDYLRNCHPMKRSPVMQTEGGYLFEKGSILRHIARETKTNSLLYGRTNFEAGQVDAWVDFATMEMDPFASVFFNETALHQEHNAEKYAAAVEKVVTALEGLELWMETRTLLVSERVTIADIAVAGSLSWAFRLNVEDGAAWTKKYSNSYRLYNTVMQQPKTVEALSKFGATFGLPASSKFSLDRLAPELQASVKATIDQPSFRQNVVAWLCQSGLHSVSNIRIRATVTKGRKMDFFKFTKLRSFVSDAAELEIVKQWLINEFGVTPVAVAEEEEAAPAAAEEEEAAAPAEENTNGEAEAPASEEGAPAAE